MTSVQRVAGIVALMGAMVTQAFGQVNVDSLRRAEQARVDSYRVRVTQGAAIFLDASRAAQDRLSAVQDIGGFLEGAQFDAGVRVATSSSEPLAIRLRALELVGERVLIDSTLGKRIAAIATDTTIPSAVRGEAVRQLASATFLLHGKPGEYLAALRIGARHPDAAVRLVALRTLAGHGDAAGLAMLSQGLETPTTALVPPSDAVQFLGLKDPSPYYDLLSRLTRNPPDSETRLAAIVLLGNHAASRADLVRFLGDRQESTAVRHAALGALAAGDPRGLAARVAPVALDEQAPLDLRLRAIMAVETMRTSRDPRMLSRAPDTFDRAMEQLAASSPSSAVREAARRYLARTRTPR